MMKYFLGKTSTENVLIKKTSILPRFLLFVLIERTHRTRYYNLKAPYYYTNLVEGGCAIQGDVLIEESVMLCFLLIIVCL